MSSQSFTKLSYDARIHNFANPAARRLLETMERKKTNLCVSVDVTKAAEVLQVVRLVGASCCMVKVGLRSVRYLALLVR
jgi:orotidine-5'-phosphate decarboxylase